jgi:DNA-binding response OmpR family regulator
MRSESGKALADIRVLLVEDEPLIAVGVADQLTEAGARVIGPCSTAGRAIIALDEQPIDVAIIDYVLSDDNSEALQDALETRGIPFIVVTGYPRVLVRRDARQRVLSKPVSPEVLASTVASLSREVASADSCR